LIIDKYSIFKVFIASISLLKINFMKRKSSTEEIRERFDKDVERFSNLDTGQVATIDATFSLEIITDVAKKVSPNAQNVLDIGCGAGNYTIKLLSKISNFNSTLIDLSLPMLERAYQRISPITTGTIALLQDDFRVLDLKENHFDVIMAGAVLHHLRDDADWENAFRKLYKILKPGGCLLISDMVTQENEHFQEVVWGGYGKYLESVNGAEYRQKVFDYIEIEDSPRPVTYQLDLMRKIGFRQVDILHKNMNFAAFGAVK
jgi:tRNA (cmo5U34)-methyltransferase